MRPLCSVVCCSYNRKSLFARSVKALNRSKFPLDRLEVVLVDDQSEEELLPVFNTLDPRIQTRYVRLRKEPGLWRDVGNILNVGIRIAEGANVAITHPEVMVGVNTLTAFCDGCTGWSYSCAKVYYLKPTHTDDLDSLPWETEGNLVVRKFPDFYTPVPGGNPDYEPAEIDKAPDWRSWVWGGHSRAVWKALGGFLVSRRWGSCDVLYSDRRRTLGMEEHCAMDENTYCLHQWHTAPRDIEATHQELLELVPTLPGLAHPEIDYLW